MDAAWLVKTVVDWLPFLVFISVLFYLLRKMQGRQQPYMADLQRYYAAHLEETRKANESLQRIAAALEKSTK